jgi:hypothetical protein
MNATNSAAPISNKRRRSLGSEIFLIVIFSFMAGSRLQMALMRYIVPRESFEWIGDLILGIGFLVGATAVALRLRGSPTVAPLNEKERSQL